MFADLKKQLTSVESKMRAVVSSARGKAASAKKDVENIDKEFVGVFDRFNAEVKKVEQAVNKRIGSVETSIQKIAPPK